MKLIKGLIKAVKNVFKSDMIVHEFEIIQYNQTRYRDVSDIMAWSEVTCSAHKYPEGIAIIELSRDNKYLIAHCWKSHPATPETIIKFLRQNGIEARFIKNK